MANDLNRSIKIYIDGTEAAQGIQQVETAIQKLESKLASLDKTEANYATRSKQLQKEIGAKTRVLQTYKQKNEETDRVLKNLSGSTYNQLIAVQSQLRKQLRSAVPGTQQYTSALEQNRRVTEALTHAQNAMRVEVGCQGNVFGKAAVFLNKYMALIGGVIASVTGISMTIRRSVEDYAQISEAMAGVKKYTGMTDEAVRDLNESFKAMDTRTSRERLNELAQDAGRLGIKGKQDILDFVDAANTINVALGEDLGQDAVKNIGKLAQMFGDDEKLGLRGAMLATGSAINEVAQNSSAAEAYLVDFTARVAGTGKQAGISQSQIMGFASVLDQDMQQVEMSATALQTVIMKVYQEPATFAKMAGKDVKEFTELLKTDANEAILTLLENLGSKGGLQELAPLFKDMKLDGVRASGVINTLAANVGRVREEQERATIAYKEGTSVINEFNVQNNTVQAKLEKAKQGFQEISYELGEKLSPYMTHLITTTGSLVKGMNILIGIIINSKGAILTAAASIAMYTIAVKIHTMATTKMKTATGEYIIMQKLSSAWDKINASSKKLHSAAMYTFSGNTKMAKESLSAFFRILKVNPYAAVLTAITAIVGAVYLLTRRTDAATKAEMTLSDIRKDAITNISGETTHIERLYAIANDENKSKESRIAAIKRLNEISPEYLGHLNLENIQTQGAKKSLDAYIESLVKKATVELELQKLADINAKMAQYGGDSLEYLNKEVNAFQLLWNGLTSGSAIPEWNEWVEEKKRLEENLKENMDSSFGKNIRSVELVTSELEAAKKRLTELQNMAPFEKELLDYDYNQVLKDVKAGVKRLEEEKRKLSPASTISTGNIPTDDEKAKKILEKQLDDETLLHTRHQSDLKALYLSGNSETLQTEKQFAARMEQLEIEHHQRIIGISGEQSKEGIDAQNAINDIKIKQRKADIQQQVDDEKILYEQQQQNLKELYASGKDENLNTEAAYNDALQQLAIMHLDRMLLIANLDADQRRAVEKQLLDFKIKCLQDEESERKRAADKDQKNKDASAKRDKQRLDRQAQQYVQYGQQLGDSLGAILSKQENAMENFADVMIDIMFDVLTQIINAELIKLTGIGISAAAEATAKEVGSKGFLGIATGAILAGIVATGIAAAKSGLKGLIGKRKDSAASNGSDAPKTAQVKVSQWATGRYDVIGQDDGKPYHDVPYIGPAPTGIVRRTSLISENGAELIINAEDLSRLQRHVNYPVVVQAIQESRSGHVSQRATGNYDVVDNNRHSNTESSKTNDATSDKMEHLLTTLASLIVTLKHVKAYVVLRDLHEAEELDRKSKEPFTKSIK